MFQGVDLSFLLLILVSFGIFFAIFIFVISGLRRDPVLEAEILSVFRPGMKLSEREVHVKLQEISSRYIAANLSDIETSLTRLMGHKKLELAGSSTIIIGERTLACKIYALPGYKDFVERRRFSRESN